MHEKMKDFAPCEKCGSYKIRHLWPEDKRTPVFGIKCRKCGHLKRWEPKIGVKNAK